MEEIKDRVEKVKTSLNESIQKHQHDINHSLNELLERIQEIKVAPLNPDGSLEEHSSGG